MLKSELEAKVLELQKENTRLVKDLTDFKGLVTKGLEGVVGDTCTDSHEYVRNFIDALGVHKEEVDPKVNKQLVVEDLVISAGVVPFDYEDLRVESITMSNGLVINSFDEEGYLGEY